MFHSQQKYMVKRMEKSKKGNKEGEWQSYYKSGQLRTKGNFKGGKREGLFVAYYKDGLIWTKLNFTNGQEDSQLWTKGNYINGKRNGIWQKYDDVANLSKTGILKTVSWHNYNLSHTYKYFFYLPHYSKYQLIPLGHLDFNIWDFWYYPVI